MSFNNQYQSSEKNSLIKTLLFLIVSAIVIIASLIVLLTNNKNLDRNINRCISNNTQLISTSNNLIHETGSAQRRLLSLALVTDKTELQSIYNERDLAISNSQKCHNKIVEHLKSKTLISELSYTVKKSIILRIEYIKSADKFITLVKKKTSKHDISYYLSEVLSPKFKKYRLNQLRIYELLNKQFITESQTITKKSSIIVWIVFIVGVIPFLFVFRFLTSPK